MLNNLIKKYLLEQEEKKTKLDHLKANYLDDVKKKKKTTSAPDGIANPEEVDKKFKRRKKIPESYLLEIVKSDPTSVVAQDAKSVDQIQKVGEYTQWIVNRYFDLIPKDYSGKKDERFGEIKESVRLFFEDLYKVTNNLKKFNRFKGQLEKKDITQIKSVRELYELTQHIDLEDAVLTHKQKQEKLKQADIQAKKQNKHNADYVYEDSKWEVLVPKTKQAAADISADPLTQWCTADLSRNYFKTYTDKGPLYIMRDKTKITPATSRVAPNEPTPEYQFEFVGGNYYDKHDHSINVTNFLNEKENEGLKNFFKPMFQKALSKETFNIQSSVFQNYIKLYGAGEDLKQQIRDILITQIKDSDNIDVCDDKGNFQHFIALLGYEEFLKHFFENLSPDLKILEIMFTKYPGGGYVVPESICTCTTLHNLILQGFIKKLPDNIGNLQNLNLLSLEGNGNLHHLPPSAAKLNLHILNIINTPVKIPDVMQQAADAGELFLISE